MKNLLLLLSLAVLTCPAMAQNENPGENAIDTVSLISNPVDSLCNYFFKTEGCAENAPYKNAANGYHTAPKELVASAWSYNIGNCPRGYVRTVINFNGINNIPQNAVVTKAELKLYGWSSPTQTITVGNSYYPGSPYNNSGSNEMLIKRITQSFHYPTVTWNNQPPTDTPVVITRPSVKQYEDDLQVDVKRLVQDMVTRQEFYGFMMMMQDETLYRSFGFHSCFAENPSKRPQLFVTYTTNSVSVNNTINENYLEIYPQPAADVVNVEFAAHNAAEVQYQLFDMRGSLVAQNRVQAVQGANLIQLQLSGLSSGVYVFTMTDGHSQLRKRIVKQ